MASANVERIRHFHALVADQPFAMSRERVRAAWQELLHPEIEWHDQRELPGATVHRGIDVVMKRLAAVSETLDYRAIELRGVLDAGGCVVATYRLRARGASSGAAVERDASTVYSFRADKVVRVEIFATEDEALKAAELAPGSPAAVSAVSAAPAS